MSQRSSYVSGNRRRVDESGAKASLEGAKTFFLRASATEVESLHALGLAATPQERWDLWEQSVRSSGYWTRSKRNKSVT